MGFVRAGQCLRDTVLPQVALVTVPQLCPVAVPQLPPLFVAQVPPFDVAALAMLTTLQVVLSASDLRLVSVVLLSTVPLP